MKYRIHLFSISILFISLISCDRVINKTERVAKQVKDRTEQELKEQSKRLMDKVFPPFDQNKPDTENNKKRFKGFLKVPITSDVNNIYCFDDALGIDADYMFSFNCNAVTSSKIIEVNNLVLDTVNTDNAFGLQHDFEWWDKDRIEKLSKYSWTDGDQYFKYFWYDLENRQAYFFDFDL